MTCGRCATEPWVFVIDDARAVAWVLEGVMSAEELDADFAGLDA